MSTRIFFVVHPLEKEYEIFETLEEAMTYAFKFPIAEISINTIKNAFKEPNGEWNYTDLSDTLGMNIYSRIFTKGMTKINAYNMEMNLFGKETKELQDLVPQTACVVTE